MCVQLGHIIALSQLFHLSGILDLNFKFFDTIQRFFTISIIFLHFTYSEIHLSLGWLRYNWRIMFNPFGGAQGSGAVLSWADLEGVGLLDLTQFSQSLVLILLQNFISQSSMLFSLLIVYPNNLRNFDVISFNLGIWLWTEYFQRLFEEHPVLAILIHVFLLIVVKT